MSRDAACRVSAGTGNTQRCNEGISAARCLADPKSLVQHKPEADPRFITNQTPPQHHSERYGTIDRSYWTRFECSREDSFRQMLAAERGPSATRHVPEGQLKIARRIQRRVRKPLRREVPEGTAELYGAHLYLRIFSR